MASFYPEGNTALWTDDPQRSLVKIVDLLQGGGGGGGSGNTFFGVGSPEGSVTSPPGGIYTNTAGELWAKETGAGNTGWTTLIG